MAHAGIKVQVRNGGTVIGRQGSSFGACLCLLLFAPVRLLPKRVRIDIVEETSQVKVQALLDDSFFLPKVGGLVAGRYRRQFDEWLDHLQGQVLPSDIPDADLGPEPEQLQAAALSSNGHAWNGVTSNDASFILPGQESLQETVAAEMGAPPALLVKADTAEVATDVTALEDTLSYSSQDSIKGVQAAEAPLHADETAKTAPAARLESRERRRFRFPRLGFGKHKEAVARGEELPEEARRQAGLGDEAAESKAWPQALIHYDAAIQAATGKPQESAAAKAFSRLFFKRGLAHFTQGQTLLALRAETERSISDYQIAIETTRKAVADYSEAIRLDSGWSMAYYRRGEAHLFAARCERGSRSFRRSSEELTQAVQDLTRATERNPTFASAFAVRAVAHSLLDRREESESDVAKAASLGADVETLRKAIQASKSWRS